MLDMHTYANTLSTCAKIHQSSLRTHTFPYTHAHSPHTHMPINPPFSPSIHTHTAMLTQWCEELGRLMLMRHNRMAAISDVNRPSHQSAMAIAQAAAAHAASQQMNKQPTPYPPG